MAEAETSAPEESAEPYTSYLRYVRHCDVADYLARGWEVSSDLVGTHHGFYSKILIWSGHGEPP
jgi:hypothetical protein